MIVLRSVLVVMISATVARAAFEQAPSCKVFCQGPLLDAVQRAHLFPDSKDFVDMPMVYDSDTTLAAFEQLPNKTDPAVLREFVSQYFTEPGTELLPCQQSDWLPEPKAFDRIHDPVYRQWAYNIHSKWRTLCRRVPLSTTHSTDFQSRYFSFLLAA